MKLILAILILFTTAVQGQTKVLQAYDYLYVYNSSQVTQTPSCINDKCFNSLISTDTIARVYDNGIVYWKGTLAAVNISDTLSASGITGLCRVTVPTTFNNQRIVQLRDLAIIFQSTTYAVEYADNFYSLPLTIRKISDGSVMCVIYETGAIDWETTPQWAWLGRVGTTRVKRISLP